MSLSSYTNEELLSLYKSMSQDMMYYQCAEGESWYKERPQREACSAEFRKIREEMKSREIDEPKGSYLV